MFQRSFFLTLLAGAVGLCVSGQSRESLPPPPDPELRQHAVVIGVNQYQADSGWSSLAFPESDATRVGRLLNSFYGFETVTVLTGKKTTRDHLLEGLKQACDSAGPDDALLLFYAGHGYAVTDPTSPKRGGYWIPSDGTRNPDSWINVDTLLNYMLSSKARHVLLISDSCYAGSFFQRGLAIVEAGRPAPVDDAGLYGRQVRKASRFILTSGDFEEVPDKSVFTAEFIHKLEGKRPIFSAEDVYFQVKDAVYDQTNNQVLAKEMLDDGAGGNFVFSQRKIPAKDTLVILSVSPPLADVSVTGVVHQASAIIVDPFDALIGEHRLRFEGGGSRSCRIQAPGYFSADLNFRIRPGGRLEKSVTLREWKPRGLAPVAIPSGGPYTSKVHAAPVDALVKNAGLVRARWSSQKATVWKDEPAYDRVLLGVYDTSTNPQGGRRNSRMVGSQVKILSSEGAATDAPMLVCHVVEPKRKDERVGREVRDTMGIANNPSLIVVLTGDFVFVFDAANGTLLFRERLAEPLKKSGSGRLHLVSRDDAPDRPMLVVSVGGTAVAGFEFTF